MGWCRGWIRCSRSALTRSAAVSVIGFPLGGFFMATLLTASPVRVETNLFINGKFVKAADGATAPSMNPHDNTTIAEVAMAGKADVDEAVRAAQAAFPSWSGMAAADRGRLLLKLANAIE